MAADSSRTPQLSYEKLFKPFSPDNHGLFGIMQAVYIDHGEMKWIDPKTLKDMEDVRCDNLNWTGVGFKYVDGKKIYGDGWVHISNVTNYAQVLDVAPYFFVTYFELRSPAGEKESLALETFSPPIHEQIWWAKSLAEFLRNTYEWSEMVDSPWDNEEGIAVHSRRFFDILNFPPNLIDEIKSYPDMHVFRYLKGEANARLRPTEFPNVSDEMKEFFWSKAQQYPPLLPHERI